ncbi:hypothetical protein K0M31_008362 [Melipona bicolor]|uniref:Uncharacterized protein n=1 Tax=Melipona bicolor TaxID=60889 RepID=A0AA40FRG8_9HYME|nr:hypothetical protein K0M31_008362 [Melipona bicolor]
MQGKQITKEILPRNPRRLGSDIDAEKSEPKGEKSSKVLSRDEEAVFSSNVLSKSEPLLKSISSLEEEDDGENVALTSESSIARRKKMKMIVARIGPLLSSGSNLSSSTNTSEMDVIDGNYEAKKLESKTALPVLQVITRGSHFPTSRRDCSVSLLFIRTILGETIFHRNVTLFLDTYFSRDFFNVLHRKY